MLDLWLILHFLGVALGVGTGFAMMTLGIASKDMPLAEQVAFMRRASLVSKNGSVGLLLLIVSGVAILSTRGADVVMAWGGRMFHIKLTLVVILIGVFGYMQVLMRKARSADGAAAAARLPVIGRVMLLLGVSIVICAVLAFH
jgi:uncharacterized membrane protein